MDSVVICYSDAHGKEVVDGETVRAALDVLNNGEVKKAKQILNDVCPELPDRLKNFELIE